MDYQTLNLLFRCNKELSHQRLGEFGFNDTECMICFCVINNKNFSQDDVCRALHIDKTTMTKSVQNLEAKKMLTRKCDKVDHRKKILSVTAKGKKCVDAMMEYHNEWIKSIAECMTADEQKQFDEYLLRILHEMEKQVAENEAAEKAKKSK